VLQLNSDGQRSISQVPRVSLHHYRLLNSCQELADLWHLAGTIRLFFSFMAAKKQGKRKESEINLLSQRMIIINMKSFLKLFRQLLRFIAVSVTPEKYKSLVQSTKLYGNKKESPKSEMK
jgi:hypothetical protein